MRHSDKLQSIRSLQNKNALFFGNDDSEHGFARPDTLGVYIESASMEDFYKQKVSQLETLKKISNDNKYHDIDLSDYLLPFEQVLAHEAYHIYQFLTCTVMSDHASSMRRKGRVELQVLHELLSRGSIICTGTEILDFDVVDKGVEQYIDRITADAYDSIKILDQRQTENHLSLREIIEACAVSFQLISQNDYLNKKLPFTDPTYTVAWDRFVAKLDDSVDDPAVALVARLVFLFAGDVYLKFSHNDFQDTNDFDEALDLVAPLVNDFSKYIEEFEGSEKIRDELFMRSITDVERDASVVEAITDYIGLLPTEGQMRLYANIRLYSDVFKRVALSGAPERIRPNNNKNRAVNRRLTELFPYWTSDFVIPCVLSDFEQSSKFATIWMRIHETKFMDEIEQRFLSLEEDNFALNFINNFSSLLLHPSSGARCCNKHGYEDNAHILMGCVEPDSLNQSCVTAFGKSLREIVTI